MPLGLLAGQCSHSTELQLQQAPALEVRRTAAAEDSADLGSHTHIHTQIEATLEMENPGKRTGTTDTSITNRIQEMEASIDDIDTFT